MTKNSSLSSKKRESSTNIEEYTKKPKLERAENPLVEKIFHEILLKNNDSNEIEQILVNELEILDNKEYSLALQELFYRFCHPDQNGETREGNLNTIVILMEKIFRGNVFFNKNFSEILTDRIHYDEHSGMNVFSSIFRNEKVANIFFNFFEQKFSKEKFVEYRGNFLKSCLLSQDALGFTPLISACTNNSPKSVKLIFAAVNNFVSEEEKSEFIKELLRQKDKEGFTPLISACTNNSPESVKLIFEEVNKFVSEGEKS